MVSKVTMDIEIQAYVDARIAESEGRSHSECEALRETFDLRLRALFDLIEKAERLLEIRLAGLNEWREQNKQQTAKHATKQELEAGLGILRATYDSRLKVIEALLVSIILIVIGGYLIHIGIGG